MPRHSWNPIRALANEEREALKQVARSRSEAAEVVARAKSLLAVAAGGNFEVGARAAGRKSGYGVAKLVKRFNRDGLQALHTKPGAGRPAAYTPEQRNRILAEFRRKPDTCTTVRCVSRAGWHRDMVVDDSAAGAAAAAGLGESQPGYDPDRFAGSGRDVAA